MKTFSRGIRLLYCVATAGIITAASPGFSSAQNADDGNALESSRRTTIVIDEEGRVFVDGEQVEHDGAGPLRLERPDGDILLLRPRARVFPHGEKGAPLRLHLDDGALFDAERFARDFTREFDPARFLSGPFERLEALHADLAVLAEENEEVLRLERETRELARKLRRAEGAERTRLERELHARLSRAFDVRAAARRKRVDRLEDEIRSEREELRQRERSKDEIIERRKRELVGDSDELEW